MKTKSFFLFLIAGILVFVSILLFNALLKPEYKTSSSEKIYSPARLVIEKISLDTEIEDTGVDSERRMDVPSDYRKVGWWKFGAKPGETGSAVLAGHNTLDNGKPGVFSRLKNLKIGDNLIVTGVSGNEQKFEIKQIKAYSTQDFPTEFIYADKGGRKLNLVTCAGRYVKSENDYSERLVIFSEKIL